MIKFAVLSAVVFGAAVSFAPPSHAAPWVFQSPTGNIACHMSETGPRAISVSTTMHRRRDRRTAITVGATVWPSITVAGQPFSVATGAASSASYQRMLAHMLDCG
jgi:hypothetical protein